MTLPSPLPESTREDDAPPTEPSDPRQALDAEAAALGSGLFFAPGTWPPPDSD